MNHWLTLQTFTALNTMYSKTFGKQTTYISPKGNEKQIDYIMIKRRHLKYNKYAEANDMIHMGSDHRCVMATLVINTPKKKMAHHETNKDKLRTTKQNNRKQTDKKIGEEEATFGRRYEDIIQKIKEKAEAADTDLKHSKKTLRRQKPKKNRKMKKKAVAQSRSGSRSGYKRSW